MRFNTVPSISVECFIFYVLQFVSSCNRTSFFSSRTFSPIKIYDGCDYFIRKLRVICWRQNSIIDLSATELTRSQSISVTSFEPPGAINSASFKAAFECTGDAEVPHHITHCSHLMLHQMLVKLCNPHPYIPVFFQSYSSTISYDDLHDKQCSI